MKVIYDGIELGTTTGAVGEVGIAEIDFAYPEIRDSDSPREAADGVLPGRDYFGARTMTIECWTNGKTVQEARTIAANVLRRWRDAKVRLRSGLLAPLDFQAAGDTTWRRVYGRPRRADDPDFDIIMRQGRASFLLEFEVMDPRFYAGGPDGEEIAQIGVVDLPPSSGWSPPWSWPVVLEAALEARPGSINVTGELPTPAIIEFHGPGKRFSLDGSRGWHVGLAPSVTLAYDEVITINPLAGTVTDNFGRDRYGALDRRSQLTNILLDPGVENVFFSVEDQSLTAQAIISWRPAYTSTA